uniref:Uncharacterized protein n=1 Tax=Arundo donax TaxID=35708 RepID=A0A0A9HDE4_ARUDO
MYRLLFFSFKKILYHGYYCTIVFFVSYYNFFYLLTGSICI